MCYRTLRRLVKTKKIRKGSRNIEQPNYFFIDEVGQPLHTIGVNFIWLYFEKWKKYQAGDSIEVFQTEPMEYLPYLRPDAFVTVKNMVKKCKIFYFVEFDVYESGNAFDKVKRYNDLFEAIKTKKVSYPWLQETNGFPQIVIVTSGSTDRIKKIINRENRNGLDFEVRTLDDIKKQCLKEI